MRIEQLQYLIAINQYHSMNKASQNLFVTQQSISSAIQDLERELDISLAIRTNRGTYLTDAGTALVQATKEFFMKCEKIQQNFSKQSSEQIHFLLKDSFAQVWEQLYLYFMHHFPEIQLIKTTINSDNLKQALNSYPDAIAIIMLDDSLFQYYNCDNDYHCELIHEIPYSLEVSPKSLLSKNNSVSIMSLQNLKILFFSSENEFSSLYFALQKYELEARNNKFLFNMSYTLRNSLLEKPDVVCFSPSYTFPDSAVLVRLKEKLSLNLCCISKHSLFPLNINIAQILKEFFL